MQKNIESITKIMLEEGYSNKEIDCFTKGLHEGIRSVQLSMVGAKMEHDSNETDPLYIHTWNDVVEGIDNMLDKLIKDTFEAEENKE